METEMPRTVWQGATTVPAPGAERVLTSEALAFLADLHARFEARRQEVLAQRAKRQATIAGGQLPGFRADTRGIRDDAAWRVAPIPPRLQDRRVEITGPVERKMMINALNSGALVFMADFEDSHSPTWAGTIQGQINIQDAVRGELTFDDPSGKRYEVGDRPALLVVRVRGWHLDEVHVRFSEEAVSASLFDFALTVFHNAKQQIANGDGPYFYLPKMESTEEATLWDDVFTHAERRLGLAHGTIKATVLIETLPAALQMEEILHALRHHIVALNAGRWDYIFSCIKTFRDDPGRVLPDRQDVSMTTPFMRAYTELLVKTCHKRGAFAMGGMSAFIPDKRDPERNEKALAAVRADKEREVRDGFDGTWVAHPGLVDLALSVFDEGLGGKPNQATRQRDDVQVDAAALLSFDVPDGHCTMDGLRTNIDVGIRYIDSWLAGRGAAAIHGLMEDAATAEISRSQVWQWLRHGVRLDDGPALTHAFVAGLVESIATGLADDADDPGRTLLAARLFEQVALARDFPDFLTVIAYPHLEDTP